MLEERAAFESALNFESTLRLGESCLCRLFVFPLQRGLRQVNKVKRTSLISSEPRARVNVGAFSKTAASVRLASETVNLEAQPHVKSG